MKTQKSVRTDSSRRLRLMVPMICPKSVCLSILTALATFVVAPGLMGQTTAHFAHASLGPVQMSRFHLTLPAQPGADSSNIRTAGFQAARLSYRIR